MKRVIVLAAALLSLSCLQLKAQHFDPEHRHSVELSSGFPPIHAFMLGSNGSYRMYAGFSEDTNFRGSVTLGYTYAINEKWDFNAAFNLASHFYTRTYYNSTEETDEAGYPFTKYDWDSVKEVKSDMTVWPSYMANFRWKWYRSDKVRLYSSFGLSYLPWIWPIFPNLTPIGINFGGNHFYGLAEFNFSTAATFAHLGLGYRF